MRFPAAWCPHDGELVRVTGWHPDVLQCRTCAGPVHRNDTGRPPADLESIRTVAMPQKPEHSEKRAEHIAYWTELVMGSDWPADAATAACEAIKARGPRQAARALRKLAACDGWIELDAPDRAVLRTILVDGASSPHAKDDDGRRCCWIYPGIANATIGSTKTDGTGWRQPVLDSEDSDGPPWQPVSDVDASAAVWPGRGVRARVHGAPDAVVGRGEARQVDAGRRGRGRRGGRGRLADRRSDRAGLGNLDRRRRRVSSRRSKSARRAGGRIRGGPGPRSLHAHAIIRSHRGSPGKHAPADLRLVIIDSARGLLTADGGDEDRSDDVRRTLGAIAQW